VPFSLNDEPQLNFSTPFNKSDIEQTPGGLYAFTLSARLLALCETKKWTLSMGFSLARKCGRTSHTSHCGYRLYRPRFAIVWSHFLAGEVIS